MRRCSIVLQTIRRARIASGNVVNTSDAQTGRIPASLTPSRRRSSMTCASWQIHLPWGQVMVTRFNKVLALALLSVQTLAIPQTNALAQATGGTQPTQQERPIKLGTSEVVVDAVVVDKRNRVVTD